MRVITRVKPEGEEAGRRGNRGAMNDSLSSNMVSKCMITHKFRTWSKLQGGYRYCSPVVSGIVAGVGITLVLMIPSSLAFDVSFSTVFISVVANACHICLHHSISLCT